MNPSKTLVLAALAWTAGCKGDLPPASPAPAIPWQPHGFRAPTVRCEFDVPEGLKKSESPMPDHIAELMSATMPPKVTLIISERVESDVSTARTRVLEYFGKPVLTDAVLEKAQAPAHLLTVRTAPGQLEQVTLLAFPGLPLVEVVGRSGDADAGAVMTFTRSVRCMKGTAP